MPPRRRERADSDAPPLTQTPSAIKLAAKEVRFRKASNAAEFAAAEAEAEESLLPAAAAGSNSNSRSSSPTKKSSKRPPGARAYTVLDGGDIRQQMAVLLIERHYYNYMHVRPGQFCDAYGSLRFVGDRKARVAKYAVVPDDVVDMRVTRLIVKHWKARPSALISVTGGAKDFVLRPRLKEVFSRGLLSAARATSAMVLTGGTASGVMALVGSALGAAADPPPLVGFTPWACVDGRHVLDGVQHNGDEAPVPYVVPDGRVGLEPNHSHFVLVEPPAGAARGTWGDEIEIRDGVQKSFQEMFNVPCVLVVVQGGFGTLRTVEKAVTDSRCPVVLLADSGGAAAALAACVARWDAHRSDPWSEAAREKEAAAAVADMQRHFARPLTDAEKAQGLELLQNICGGHKAESLVTSFELQHDSTDEIDSAILKAILYKQEQMRLEKARQEEQRRRRKSQRGHHFDSQSGSAINLLHQSSNASVIAAPSPGKALTETSTKSEGGGGGASGGGVAAGRVALRLAVNWGRTDVMQALLVERLQRHANKAAKDADALSQITAASPSPGGAPSPSAPPASNSAASRHADIQYALQLALEQRCAPIAELLLAHQAEVASVNLCALYEAAPPPSFDRSKFRAEAAKAGKKSLKALELDAEKDRLVHDEAYESVVVPFLEELVPGFSHAFEHRKNKVKASKAASSLNVLTGVAAPATPGSPDTPGGFTPPSSKPRRISRNGFVSPKAAAPAAAPKPTRSVVRALDVFMWAVAVHDWALTDVLIHVTKNPVRCGLLASQLCRAMSDDAGQDEDELLQRAEEFETKARAILDAVPTSVAVRGGFLFAESKAWGTSLLGMAWTAEHKLFLCHPHCVKLVGLLSHRSALLRLVKDDEKLSGFWLVLASLWMPLRCVDIKHAEWEAKKGTKGVRPKEWRLSEPQPLSCTKRYVEYFRIPVVKRALRNTLFCAYIALFSLVVFSRGEHATLADAFADARHYQIETLFALWTIALVVDELHQFHSMEHYFNSVWNQLDLCAYSLLIAALATGWQSAGADLSSMSGRRLHPGGHGGGVGGGGEGGDGDGDDGDDMLAKASTLLFGAAAIPLFLRVLQQFQTHKQLGVLLVIIGEMMNDVASFMAIFVVFLLGFFIAFLAVMKVQAPFAALGLGHFDAGSFDEWHEQPGVWNSWRAFEVPLWAMVGENSLEAVEEASPLVGIALLWIYIIIAQVLLVNLLIAMMSSTFAKVEAIAQQEYTFGCMRTFMETRNLFVVPPPFSLPFLALPCTPCWRRTPNDEGLATKDVVHRSSQLRALEAFVASRRREDEKEVSARVDSLHATLGDLRRCQQEDREHMDLLHEDIRVLCGSPGGHGRPRRRDGGAGGGRATRGRAAGGRAAGARRRRDERGSRRSRAGGGGATAEVTAGGAGRASTGGAGAPVAPSPAVTRGGAAPAARAPLATARARRCR